MSPPPQQPHPSPPTLPPLARHPAVYASVLDLIGDTPLVEVLAPEDGIPRGRVLGKLETLNPGGSVKDRICLRMIEEAERRGLLLEGGMVIEPTSGNTGIGLALVARQRGYRCILTMPESMSLERRQLLESMGAEVVLTPEEHQMSGAIERARDLARHTPGSFMPEQFDNAENPRVHELTTAREILEALGGVPPDAFVAAVGTGGTITGVGRALRAVGATTRVVAVEPESCATLSRGERGPSKIQGIAAGFQPANYDPSVVDEIRTVSDLAAYETTRQLAKRMGLLVGMSSGANVVVARALARELGPTSLVVTLLPDTGERYFSLAQYFGQTEGA